MKYFKIFFSDSSHINVDAIGQNEAAEYGIMAGHRSGRIFQGITEITAKQAKEEGLDSD